MPTLDIVNVSAKTVWNKNIGPYESSTPSPSKMASFDEERNVGTQGLRNKRHVFLVAREDVLEQKEEGAATSYTRGTKKKKHTTELEEED